MNPIHSTSLIPNLNAFEMLVMLAVKKKKKKKKAALFMENQRYWEIIKLKCRIISTLKCFCCIFKPRGRSLNMHFARKQLSRKIRWLKILSTEKALYRRDGLLYPPGPRKEGHSHCEGLQSSNDLQL